jgi:hypothetical protein
VVAPRHLAQHVPDRAHRRVELVVRDVLEGRLRELAEEA